MPPGKHEKAGRVDFAAAPVQALRQRDDAPVPDADVAARGVGGGDHGAAADGEIELHGCLLSANARRSRLPIRRSTSSSVL